MEPSTTCAAVDDNCSETYGPHLPVNPLVHKIELHGFQKIKVYITTVVLLPIRIVCALSILLLSWLLTTICMTGWKPGQTTPVLGVRKLLRSGIVQIVRFLFVFWGFNWVRFKGKQASQQKAPVLVVGPHSSFFDVVPVICLGAPSVVAKGDQQHIPLFGRMITYAEALFVYPHDPDSRKNTIKEIARRATCNEGWPQVIVFPEGMCGNRTALLPFKPGAFIPGVPVQPVCIRYSNSLDSVTWTWHGPSTWTTMWLTLCQLHINLELEFLPVYTPSEKEKEDHVLFANNVREYMSRALDIPATDYSFDDCLLLSKTEALNFADTIAQIEELRRALQIEGRENRILDGWQRGEIEELLSKEELADLLDCPADHPLYQQLFSALSSGDDKVDAGLYVMLALHMRYHEEFVSALKVFFRFLDIKERMLTLEQFTEAFPNAKFLGKGGIERLFKQINRNEAETISFDDLATILCLKPEYYKVFSICRKCVLGYEGAKKLKEKSA